MSTEILVVFVLIATGMFGYGCGTVEGRKQGCNSVQMEWFEGSCVKVTREVLKP